MKLGDVIRRVLGCHEHRTLGEIQRDMTAQHQIGTFEHARWDVNDSSTGGMRIVDRLLDGGGTQALATGIGVISWALEVEYPFSFGCRPVCFRSFGTEDQLATAID